MKRYTQNRYAVHAVVDRHRGRLPVIQAEYFFHC